MRTFVGIFFAVVAVANGAPVDTHRRLRGDDPAAPPSPPPEPPAPPTRGELRQEDRDARQTDRQATRDARQDGRAYDREINQAEKSADAATQRAAIRTFLGEQRSAISSFARTELAQARDELGDGGMAKSGVLSYLYEMYTGSPVDEVVTFVAGLFASIPYFTIGSGEHKPRTPAPSPPPPPSPEEGRGRMLRGDDPAAPPSPPPEPPAPPTRGELRQEDRDARQTDRQATRDARQDGRAYDREINQAEKSADAATQRAAIRTFLGEQRSAISSFVRTEAAQARDELGDGGMVKSTVLSELAELATGYPLTEGVKFILGLFSSIPYFTIGSGEHKPRTPAPSPPPPPSPEEGRGR